MPSNNKKLKQNSRLSKRASKDDEETKLKVKEKTKLNYELILNKNFSTVKHVKKEKLQLDKNGLVVTPRVG